MKPKPLTVAVGALLAMTAGITIVHHSMTGTWAMTWDDLLFWKRTITYSEGIVSRSWEFTLKPGAAIVVESTDADIQVARSEGNRVGVEIWLAGETADMDNYKTLAEQLDPVTVRVTSQASEEWDPNGRGRARILLFVPERSSLTINALRGGAVVGDLKGVTAVRTAGGDIAVFGGEGPLTLAANEGKVVVERHRGGGSLIATRGTVETSYVEGSLVVSARSGVDIRSHIGPVRASSVEGAVTAELLSPDSACTLASRDGDVRLKLLPNSSVDLDATSINGAIVNTLGSDTTATEHPTYGHFMRSINGGSIPIMIRTERGNIEISGYGE